MKTKLSPIFALAIMVASCSNQELIDSDFQQPTSQQTGNIRSYEEALQIAQASIQMVDGQAQTRAASPRKIVLNDSKVCLAGEKTRSGNDQDTLMYVFNFEDNQGFAIVSASRNTEGLLAITEKGCFDPNVKSEIEGFNLFIEKAKNYVKNSKYSISSRPNLRLDPILEMKDSTIIEQTIVGPYLSVRWGQSYCEGEYCDNNIAGCVNVAMAQIMSYYEYPSYIDITYPNSDISYQSLNWTNLKAHTTNHLLANCPSSDNNTHKSLGRLCRQLGYLDSSTYYTNRTGTNPNNVPGTFQYLGYNTTNGWTDHFNSSICTNLNSQKLSIMGGTCADGGHAWVCDGYYNRKETECLMVRELGMLLWEIHTIYSVHESSFYHLNWGWYGSNNGYFSVGVFNTAVVYMPDTSSNYANETFSDVQYMVVYPN